MVWSRTKSCFNCCFSNHKFITADNLSHKSSDSNCPLFRHAYTKKRSRLNDHYMSSHIKNFCNSLALNFGVVLYFKSVRHLLHRGFLCGTIQCYLLIYIDWINQLVFFSDFCFRFIISIISVITSTVRIFLHHH